MQRKDLTDGTGGYAPFNPPYHLKLSRDDEKTFSFTWCIETKDNTFKPIGVSYTKQKSITEVDTDRNKILGRVYKEKWIPETKE